MARDLNRAFSVIQKGGFRRQQSDGYHSDPQLRAFDETTLPPALTHIRPFSSL
jgi:hypothetical protein